MFGLAQAKEAIRINDYAVLVEGNLDVIASHQADVKNVVATAGTAMTEHHLKALSRLSRNVCLCFDGDKAGIGKAEGGVVFQQDGPSSTRMSSSNKTPNYGRVSSIVISPPSSG